MRWSNTEVQELALHAFPSKKQPILIVLHRSKKKETWFSLLSTLLFTQSIEDETWTFLITGSTCSQGIIFFDEVSCFIFWVKFVSKQSHGNFSIETESPLCLIFVLSFAFCPICTRMFGVFLIDLIDLAFLPDFH